MRPLLLFLAFLMAAPQLYALSGGPFDSSSNLGGLDKRRGTYETTIRGSNIIGYAFFSASSNLESYGNCRLWVDGVTCFGNSSSSLSDDHCLTMVEAGGSAEVVGVMRVSGFIDQKVRSSGYPYRASGEGRLEISTRPFTELDRLDEIDLTNLVSITTGNNSPVDVDFNLGDLFEMEEGEEPDTTRRPIYGKTTQISMLPSSLFFTVIDGNGNANGPFAVDPTDTETFLEIINSLARGNSNNN